MAPTSTLQPGLHVLRDDNTHLSCILSGMVHLHASCVLTDGTLATFLPPFDHDKLLEWWKGQFAQTLEGLRHIIFHISRVSDRSSGIDVKAPWQVEGRSWPTIQVTGNSKDDLEVSGVVMLYTPFSETGPFRAEVHKLFVSPYHRRKGIARQMMARLETVALSVNRWNLMLDTTVGSSAESVYPRLGYERLGVVTEYGIHPLTAKLVDEVWFWKNIKKNRLEERDE
jgi:GNAT superfamily N-acetyltransferase